jgi:MFS family permease
LAQTAQIIAVARHHRSRVRAVAGRYREARRSLHTPASAQSRRGLDWMNFFVADVQTSFGAFVAFYLAELGWSQGSIGVALTAGAIAGTLSLIPGGALADAVNWKRGLAALGIAMSAAAALILAFLPHRVFVFVAEILQGATAGVITPAIGAISLGLVGRSAMSLRTGRNYRYAAGGHAVTAALMGVAGAYVANAAIFVAAAALCVPALIALRFIRGDEIDYAWARNARRGEGGSGKERASAVRILELVRNRKFILFAAATVLFQLADASILPLVGENIATSIRDDAALWMSGLIIVPQVLVAALAPWVGFHSEKKGRRPLLLIGFGLEPLRALLLAFSSSYSVLVVGQCLSGVTGAIVGVMTVVVVTDLTADTGRFNLAVGIIGTLSAIAASVSTSATGFVFQAVGPKIGYPALALIAAAATVLVWAFLSETKPAKYGD